jgi:hypothetical protein
VFKRRQDIAAGDYMRRGLEPMAEHLGLDYDESFFSPPQTPEARTFDAFRVGQSLLMFLSYPEGWMFGTNPSKRRAKRAARAIHDSLVLDAGQSAVSHMTQGYAREMAALWQRAAGSGDPDLVPAQLFESARRSEDLGELAARSWPVRDPYGALDHIAQYEKLRVILPADPTPMIDVDGYYGRAGVAFGAALIAMGAALEEHRDLACLPVAHLDLQVASGLQHDWVFNAKIWQNLLSDQPLPYADFMRSS